MVIGNNATLYFVVYLCLRYFSFVGSLTTDLDSSPNVSLLEAATLFSYPQHTHLFHHADAFYPALKTRKVVLYK